MVRILLARTRHRIHTALVAHLATARVYARLRPAVRACLVADDTALVIEGFPRSANTYAATAFRLSNGDQAACIHHLHSPVNVEEAARRGIPVIVLLRDPLDAVVSELQRYPHLSATGLVREYIRFYQRILPITDSVVLAPFEMVTADFGSVVREVNTRFRTTFSPYERTPESEQLVLDELSWADMIVNRHRGIREHTVARPSAERDREKPFLRAQVLARAAPEMARARALYERLTAAGYR